MANKESSKNYHHGDLRNALLRAAAELVVTQGVEGFSLREASRRVGVSPTACYRHFSDKSALLQAVASEGFADLAQNMDGELSKLSFVPSTQTAMTKQAVNRFIAVGYAYVKFAVDNPAQFRVMFGPYGAGGSTPVRGISAKSGMDPYEIFVSTLDGLVECKAISSQSRVNAEIPAWAAIHGLAALWVDGLINTTESSELITIIKNILDTSLRGLGYGDELR